MSTPTDRGADWAASTRVLAATLMSALVLIGTSLWFVLGQDDMSSPPVLVLAGLLALGVAVHLTVEAVGYRAEPLSASLSDAEVENQTRTRWQATMILRFALAESVAIVSIAVAFVVSEGGFLTYVVGAAISLALMVLHVWPGARPVGKVADALERDGRRSGLREAFGVG